MEKKPDMPEAGPPAEAPGAPVPPAGGKGQSPALKWILLVVGLLVIIGIVVLIIVIASGDDDEASEETSKKASDKAYPEPGEEVQKGVVGDTLTVGDLKVTVNDWEFTEGEEPWFAEEGSQYVVVDVSIKNTGDETEIISTLLGMSVQTPNNSVYGIASYYPEPEFPGGDLKPGDTMSGLVTFEVPDDTKALDFVFETMDYMTIQILRFKLQ